MATHFELGLRKSHCFAGADGTTSPLERHLALTVARCAPAGPVRAVLACFLYEQLDASGAVRDVNATHEFCLSPKRRLFLKPSWFEISHVERFLL